ncbi:Chaperone protein DnaJ [Spatholobus suberectus]|nr:Chaperone protein DnaJ [Spatholobus suberectus]
MNKDESDRNEKKAQDIKLWGVFLFGVIGATVTAFSLSRLQSKGGSGSSFRSAFQEEAWKRYNKRLQEEYEEEMERVERIRRMQSVFNRERDKYRRNYESWRGNGTDAHHQHFQRDDWYWKAETSFREQWANYQHTRREGGNYSLSHHYSVLGLDRFRTMPYTDAEIKTAFRTKAKQYHPDQNQDNREAAEAKFKEIICSYEAVQQERKNQNL